MSIPNKYYLVEQQGSKHIFRGSPVPDMTTAIDKARELKLTRFKIIAEYGFELTSHFYDARATK